VRVRKGSQDCRTDVAEAIGNLKMIDWFPAGGVIFLCVAFSSRSEGAVTSLSEAVSLLLGSRPKCTDPIKRPSASTPCVLGNATAARVCRSRAEPSGTDRHVPDECDLNTLQVPSPDIVDYKLNQRNQ
jgi:hypothetical protein